MLGLRVWCHWKIEHCLLLGRGADGLGEAINFFIFPYLPISHMASNSEPVPAIWCKLTGELQGAYWARKRIGSWCTLLPPCLMPQNQHSLSCSWSFLNLPPNHPHCHLTCLVACLGATVACPGIWFSLVGPSKNNMKLVHTLLTHARSNTYIFNTYQHDHPVA